MTVRLTLVCAAAPATDTVRFADAVPDDRALERARRMAGTLPSAGDRYTAPSLRCRRTATALGWEAVAVEPELRDLDMGRWRDRTLDRVAADEPDGFAAWLTDPHASPHGGESVAGLCARVAAWADALPPDTGRMVAVVEQAAARAAILHALSAPLHSFWRVDVPPLTTVQLTGRAGRWNLRTGAAPATAPDDGPR
ncbi:histidine phosphatase family protein [Streptomyces cinnabarinus]|uniref:Histidine phosphatase family protein n=1 Tax=Streptomyces cinnabarinus TaxID=67287 RepID=A0ABY7KPH8_9ACTN|nr:histidine phosphatase family protein [Streptomyces cinnabarinus]WAZ24626.1 histidine phosphatase family protein [Streptomyces cinnabarinus]